MVPILSFKNFDEVIKRANDNVLGLASYIYTNNLEQAHRASELMETGTVAVNTGVVALPEAPWRNKTNRLWKGRCSMAIKDYLNIKYTHLDFNNINELYVYMLKSLEKPVTYVGYTKDLEKESSSITTIKEQNLLEEGNGSLFIKKIKTKGKAISREYYKENRRLRNKIKTI